MYGMKKKTHVWLMRWLKKMGAHEIGYKLPKYGPFFCPSKC
jgi:hypothetical protein